MQAHRKEKNTSLSRFSAAGSTLAIIDAGVTDWELLASGVTPDTQLAVLDTSRDGIEQIGEILSQHRHISALHLISHGSPGNLQLGNSTLNAENLEKYRPHLQQWQTALAPNADILLYGCSVAKSPTGKAFIEQLSRLTGANIAASATPTGNPEKGGNWKLEARIGKILSPLAIQPKARRAYPAILATSFTEDTSISLPGVASNSVAWADYNLDGFPDLLLAGNSTSGAIAKLYKNTGTSFTEDTSIALPGVAYSSVAWADYNGDGKPDFLLSGDTGTQPIAKLYKNTGTSFTEDTSIALPGVIAGSTAWADYNGDSLRDFLLSGGSTSGAIATLYLNTGTSFTADTSIALPGVGAGSVAWADYNGDGKPDFLLTGSTASGGIAKLYLNNGTSFTEDTSIALPGVDNSSVAWADYNGDGKPDFLLTGNTASGYISKLYKNTGTSFTEDTSISLPGVSSGSVAWADYNGDGFPDFLLTGNTASGYISKLYKNTGTSFTEDTSIALPGVVNASVAWADYNGDGFPDFLLAGNTNAGEIAKLYKNTLGTIFAGNGNDAVTGYAYNDTLFGEFGNDTLAGGDGNDLLFGNAGTDSVDGSGGDDIIFGGKDNDFLDGNTGNDIVGGDIGNDTAVGGDGNDLLFGNAGEDFVAGGTGEDILFGGRDADTLQGEAGNDIASGDIGDDFIDGGKGNDTLYGNAGADSLDGFEGDDILYGGKEDDTLIGNAGNDILYGDRGSDSLVGGTGSDSFVLIRGSDSDIIADFENGADKLALSSGLPIDQLSITSNGSRTLITLGSTGELLVTLNNVSSALINSEDFSLI